VVVVKSSIGSADYTTGEQHSDENSQPNS